tara:strand:- start:1989 stop:2858 length:870 start_codon:yes stop_codon:yes gene_type:complete
MELQLTPQHTSDDRACTRAALLVLALVTLLAGCGTTGIKAPVGRAPEAGAYARPAPASVRKVSPSATPRPAKRTISPGTVHTVRDGETLYAIAWRYGLDFRRLGEWNRIRAPYVIYPGQRLTLKAPVRTVAKRITHVRKSTQSVPKKTSRKPASKSSGTTSTALLKGWTWPTDGRVLRNFAQTGKAGVDFGGREGQAVVAAASGEVVYSGSGLRGYGQLIIVKHNKKFLSAYAHNKKLYVAEGDKVVRGQRIADMGSTGAERVQLHFEIRRNGKPVDPFSYLPLKPGRR